MSDLIIYVDHSEIRETKLDQLKAAMNELVEFVEANEPQLIAYHVYFNDDGTEMTVLHVHRDSASLEFHMKVAGPAFLKFAEFIKLLAIDVYGKPSEDLVKRLQRKAQLLGTGNVTVHARHAGFGPLGI